MRICPRLLAVLSGVAANCRKSWIIGVCALALSPLALSEPARAQCTTVDLSGNATCSAGTYTDSVPQPPGTFPAPINYSQPTPNTPLNVTLDSGVKVTLSSPGIAVNLNNFNGGPAAGAVLLSANGVTVDVTQVPTSSGGNRGLYVETQANNATIIASGTIDVGGEGGATTQ